MIETYLAVRGPGAPRLRERAEQWGAATVLVDRDLVVVAAPGALRVHDDGRLACLVAGRPGLQHLSSDSSADPAATIAAAFASTGDEALRRLRPPFAVLLWDRERGAGAAASDQLGTNSVFTATTSDGLVLAGEIADVLLALDRRPEPDLASLGSWLAGRGIPRDRTLYAGIGRVPGGHVIALEPYSSARRYAAPMPRGRLRGGRDELVQRVRTGLESAVAAALPRDGAAGVRLSGGVDSTSVAATATALYGRERTLAFSAVFPNHPRADESTWIALVREHLGLEGGLVRVRGGSMLRDALAYGRRWAVPSPSPMLFFQLPLQQLAARAGAARVLDGEGGDELFGLRPYLLADRVRSARLLSARRLSRRLSPGAFLEYGLKGAAPWITHRLRGDRPPDWLRDDVAGVFPEETSLHVWKALPGERWQAKAWDLVTAFRERAEAHDHLRRRAAMTGIDVAHPLLEDLDLIELAVRLPPEHGFENSLNRPLLRDAMEGRLPDEVRLRADKPIFDELFGDAQQGPDRRAYERLLGDAALLAAFVRPEFLEQVRTTPPERRWGPWLWIAWRLVVTECWLRGQVDPDFAERVPELARLGEPDVEFV